MNKTLLKRISVIDKEISNKRYPSKMHLSNLLEVSDKTIQRDIDFMKEEYSCPIEYHKLRKGYYYADDKFSLNPLTVSSSDFLEIAVTQKVLEQYSGTPFAKHFRIFYDKLSNICDEDVSISAAEIDEIYSFNIGPVRIVNGKILEQVKRAIESENTVRLKYHSMSRNVITTREVDPYHIRNYKGDWYMIGYCHSSNSVKIFAISRFKKFETTNKYFTKPEDFNIEKYFKFSLGIFESDKIYDVKLKITGESVRYINEKKWHSTEVKSLQKDGSLILKMKINNLYEMLAFCMRLGKDCTVIEPEILRKEVIKNHKEALLNYKKKES